MSARLQGHFLNASHNLFCSSEAKTTDFYKKNTVAMADKFYSPFILFSFSISFLFIHGTYISFTAVIIFYISQLYIMLYFL